MITWGIDAGQSSVKFVKLSINDGRAEVLETGHYDEKDAGPTLVFPPSPLHRMMEEHEIGKHDQVAISVPGRFCLSRFTKIPPVAENRVADIVRYEADQQIPFNMDEIKWFFHQFENPDDPDIEIGIFAIKNELLQTQLAQFEENGFSAIHMAQADPIALYNALHHAGAFSDKQLGDGKAAVVLDIGFEDAQLLVVTGTSMWVRTIPLGGDAIIQCLVKAFKLSEAKAKNLLENVEDSKYATQILQSIRPAYNELVKEIQRSVGFYSATHRDTDVAKMIVAGGCSKIQGLVKHLEQNLGIPHVEIPGVVDEQYWVAYGLALQAAGESKITAQFIPDPPTPLVAVPMAIAGALSKIRLPGFMRGMTLIEGLVVASIITLLFSIMFPVLFVGENERLAKATPEIRVEMTPEARTVLANELAKGGTYALIRVDMLPDGGVKVTPKYSPAYDEYNAASNPLSHLMIKQMMKEQILGSGTSP